MFQSGYDFMGFSCWERLHNLNGSGFCPKPFGMKRLQLPVPENMAAGWPASHFSNETFWVDIYGTVGGVDHHAWSGAIWLFHLLDRGYIHRHILPLTGLGVICR